MYSNAVNVNCLTKNVVVFHLLSHIQAHEIMPSLFFCLPSFTLFVSWLHLCIILSGHVFFFWWVDVQTGCVWAGVPLSHHLFAALILSFVCSIWAKFSNGDNYRGRPRERRRWVLPLFSSELHASPSQSITSPPAFPPCLPLMSVTVCLIKSKGKSSVCCLIILSFLMIALVFQSVFFTS